MFISSFTISWSTVWWWNHRVRSTSHHAYPCPPCLCGTVISSSLWTMFCPTTSLVEYDLGGMNSVTESQTRHMAFGQASQSVVPQYPLDVDLHPSLLDVLSFHVSSNWTPCELHSHTCCICSSCFYSEFSYALPHCMKTQTQSHNGRICMFFCQFDVFL